MNPDLQALAPVSPPDQAGDENSKPWILDQFYGGISDAEKQIVRTAYLQDKQYQFLFGQNGNILEYPNQFRINRSSVQDSPKSGANMLTALPKWIVSGQPYTSELFIYCADGKMFSRDVNGNYTYLFTAQDSQGNGLGQLSGYLYYTTNSSLGIYGPLGSPTAKNQDAYISSGVNNTAKTGWAPVNVDFGNVTVGHGNMVGSLDILTANWTSASLTLNQASYVRSFSTVNQMLAVGVYSLGPLDRNFGQIYIWDGQSTNFNAFSPHDGPVDALLNWKNHLLSFVGSANMLYDGMAPINAQLRLPKLTQDDSIEIYPGAVTEYKGQAMFGVGNTKSTVFQNGVYHWGNRNDNYPAAMMYDYTISTGHTTNIQIGCLFGTSQELFIGWGDNGSYGIDIVSPSNPFFSSASVEGVIIDDLRPVDSKSMLTVRASHLPLNTGETVQLGFKVDRNASYILSTINSVVGSTYTALPIPQDYAQFREYGTKFILGSSGATTPAFTSIGAAYMPSLTQDQY